MILPINSGIVHLVSQELAFHEEERTRNKQVRYICIFSYVGFLLHAFISCCSLLIVKVDILFSRLADVLW